MRNRALTDSFEPGSTLKPFTAALALETGKVRFDTPIQTAPGKMTIGSATISDAHAHGVLTVAQVIQKSSNIGSAKLALSMKPEEMWAMFDSLGFGAPLKLGFPGEVGGRLRPAKSWRPIEQATMAYGHGISVTLIQLARAYQVFARDGDLVPLSLARLDAPPLAGKRVFSAQTAREVRAMLEMAVQPGGTAPKAQIPGYRVAGKTGTAHKLEGGAYANKYVSSFVGFAPVSEPRLIVAVMIDEPSNGKHYGGDVAAPVFAQVMAGSLRTLGVAPDAPLKPLLMTGCRAGAGRDVNTAMTDPRTTQATGVVPTRLTADSRRVQPGDVFVAFPGAHVDGRDFIAQAVAQGAAAVIAEKGEKVMRSGSLGTAPATRRSLKWKGSRHSRARSRTWSMAVPPSISGWPASPAPTARLRCRSGSPRRWKRWVSTVQ